jgi:pyruvate-formate lyase-activating enzyme
MADMNGLLDYSQLYRLPFSKNDNFNGWIEITTACNRRCPGCYRGCDRPEHHGEARDVREIEREILTLKDIRNCSMISISGGEPLLHPDIVRIVAFVKAHRMSPVLFTNGVLLDAAMLEMLRHAGLTGAAVRIDSLQDTGVAKTEGELNAVRARYAGMCGEAGVFLILTTCVDRSNLAQIKDVIDWAQVHSDQVGQLIFILKRHLMLDPDAGPPHDATLVFMDDLLAALSRETPDLKFAAYLGSEAENRRAKWLQAFRFILAGKNLGYADQGFVEILQVTHHAKTGTYVGIREKRKNFVSLPQVFGLAVVNRSLRRVFGAFCGEAARRPKKLFARAAVQSITVVAPPHFVAGKRDLCAACPDAILYEGRLVPSCGLEEIRRFGKLRELE